MTNLGWKTELGLTEPECHEVWVISDITFDFGGEEATDTTTVEVGDSSRQSCDMLLLNLDCLSINYRSFAIEKLPNLIGDFSKRVSAEFVEVVLVHARRI